MRKNQRTSIAVYSRDQQSAPVRHMEKMLLDIRRPAISKAGRLKASGMIVDIVDPDRRDLESKKNWFFVVVQNIEKLMLKVD